MDEFEIGDEVLTLAPENEDDRYDENIFNAGWDDEMESYVGELATIIQGGSEERYGRPTYYLQFDDGEAWFWDPNWMEQKTEKIESNVSTEDFNAILI